MSDTLSLRISWAAHVVASATRSDRARTDDVPEPPGPDRLTEVGLDDGLRDLLWLAAALSLDATLGDAARELRSPGHPGHLDVGLFQRLLARPDAPAERRAIHHRLEHLEDLGFLHLASAATAVERAVRLHRDVIAWLEGRPRAHAQPLRTPGLRVFSTPAEAAPEDAHASDPELQRLLEAHLDLEEAEARPARILVLRGAEGTGRAEAVRAVARRVRGADTLTFDAAGAAPSPEALWHAAREASLYGEVLFMRNAEPMMSRGGAAVAGMVAALWRWPSRVVASVAEDAPHLDPRLERWLFWQHRVAPSSELVRVRVLMGALMPDEVPIWWPSAQALARLSELQLERCVEAWRAQARVADDPTPVGAEPRVEVRELEARESTSALCYQLARPTPRDAAERFAEHVRVFSWDRVLREVDLEPEAAPSITPLYGLPEVSAPPEVPALALPETGVPVFIGLASRGPLFDPVELRSMEDFERHFDPTTPSVLPEALQGFFANGGQRCYVVRVARIHRDDALEEARLARCELMSHEGVRLIAQATSPGAWGNAVSLTLSPAQPASRMRATRIATDAGRWHLIGDEGFEVGAHAHLLDPATEARLTPHPVLITVLGDGRLAWSGDVAQDALSVLLERTDTFSLAIRVAASEHHRKERREEHRLCLAPRSPEGVDTLHERSRFVRLRAPDDAAPTEGLLEDTLSLTGGRDGHRDLRPPHLAPLLLEQAVLRAEDADLVAFPDAHLLSSDEGDAALRELLPVYRSLIACCKARRDRLALLSPPPERLPEPLPPDLLEALESPFAMMITPALQVAGRRAKDPPRFIPAEGHVAGLLARSDREEGIHCNVHLPLTDFLGVAHVLREDTIHALSPMGVLAERRPVSGVRLYFERTLARGPEHRLDDRRFLNTLTHTLREGCAWAGFETEEAVARRELERQIGDLLKGLRADGVLLGERPEHAWRLEIERDDRCLMITVDVALHEPQRFERIHVPVEGM